MQMRGQGHCMRKAVARTKAFKSIKPQQSTFNFEKYVRESLRPAQQANK
jgi:hypothetical protein